MSAGPSVAAPGRGYKAAERMGTWSMYGSGMMPDLTVSRCFLRVWEQHSSSLEGVMTPKRRWVSQQ